MFTSLMKTPVDSGKCYFANGRHHDPWHGGGSQVDHNLEPEPQCCISASGSNLLNVTHVHYLEHLEQYLER